MPPDPTLSLLNEILPRLQQEFAQLPTTPMPAGLASAEPDARNRSQPPGSPQKEEQSAQYDQEQAAMAAVLNEAAERMADNYPYHHPLYAGQMLKPPHPVARAAYAAAMWLNPNNHALDGGRASSAMEVEAVSEIAAMFGWTSYVGHLASGGTFANLEALWVARQLHPELGIAASKQAHYTHERISGVLRLPFCSIAADARGRMDVAALEQRLSAGPGIGTVVVTLGTTAVGAVDPLDAILALRERYPFRIHVDAAYGGYFGLAANLGDKAARAFQAIGQADSIVIDPHKHGLQPYGCGCILFRDAAVGQLYKHDSPYTYFTSQQLHLGEISLECSRAGAAAVALWATQRLLPLVRDGKFAHGLARCRRAALEFHSRLLGDDRFVVPFMPELDILVWAVRAATPADSSRLARSVFEACASHDLHLALVELPLAFFLDGLSGVSASTPHSGQEPHVTCLRSVLMKPEHEEWIGEIWRRLDLAMQQAMQQTMGEQS